MTSKNHVKFETQVDSEILAAVRNLADEEGRQVRDLVDEALTDLLEKRARSRSRSDVITAYQASHEKFGGLYKKLAE